MFKSPEKIFKITMWLVSLLFASFLIGLGGKMIADLPGASHRPVATDFANREILDKTQNRINVANEKLQELQMAHSEAQNALNVKSAAYSSAKEANRNWLATRGVTTSNPNALGQDVELIRQAAELERLNGLAQTARGLVESIEKERLLAQRLLQESLTANTRELDRVQPALDASLQNYEIKAFAIRLGFIVPLLVIAGWLIAKKQKSSYWPLARGFIIFSAFAFLFEIVPFVPSFGGYFRYGIGIILCVVGGHYTIRWMQGYLARRQEETSRNEKERRAVLDSTVAIQKMAAQLCPGCERPIPGALDGVKVNHCVHCGLNLFDICHEPVTELGTICGVRKNAFYKHCPSCGVVSASAPRAPDKMVIKDDGSIRILKAS